MSLLEALKALLRGGRDPNLKIPKPPPRPKYDSYVRVEYPEAYKQMVSKPENKDRARVFDPALSHIINGFRHQAPTISDAKVREEGSVS